MENTTNSTPTPTTEVRDWFSWPVFSNRVLKTGFALLIFGGILVILVNFDTSLGNAVPDVSQLDPLSFAGAAIALIALTMMGIPIVPAAVAGAALWWLLQDVLNYASHL
jgi:hypothetical protein